MVWCAVGCEIFLICGGEMWYGVLLDVGCEIFLICGGEMWYGVLLDVKYS